MAHPEEERERLTTSDLAETEHETSRREADTKAEAGDAETSTRAAPTDATEEQDVTQPLLPSDQAGRFRNRWEEIQSGFVDRPRESVEQADALVADLMQRLAAGFSDERTRLEGQWDRGDDVSTEDLRVALTRYRVFFERLLTA